MKLSKLHFPCPVRQFSYSSLFKILTFCILWHFEQFDSRLQRKILDRFVKTIIYVSGGSIWGRMYFVEFFVSNVFRLWAESFGLFGNIILQAVETALLPSLGNFWGPIFFENFKELSFLLEFFRLWANIFRSSGKKVRWSCQTAFYVSRGTVCKKYFWLTFSILSVSGFWAWIFHTFLSKCY